MRTDYLPVLLLLPALVGASSAGFGQNSPPSAAALPEPPRTGPSPSNRDPLLDLPPLEHNRVTLMGGTVLAMDEVMNRMTFRPFGTKQQLEVHFDTRTHFYLDGKPIRERNIGQGQRVYLDTMLNQNKVFAKTIWLRTTAENGIARGQIIRFDPKKRSLTVRDELSSQAASFRLTKQTQIHKDGRPGAESDLVPDALVDLNFGAQTDLRAITILASPGSAFIFSGRVTYLDLSRKLIALDNRSDRQKYDVSVEAIPLSILRGIREGQQVTVSAVFDRDRYRARQITPSPRPKP
ncbi:MAG: hypothetical protein J2P13_02080 [Acidobacteria bacterium]|nr:hypothetical protein [Acidobacteriota bacterium]